MEAITFDSHNRLSTSPEQVIADFCTAYTPEEAQDELWRWVQPVLLDCFREQNPERVNLLVAFYERLEQLLLVVYALRGGQKYGVARPTPHSSQRHA